MPNYVVKLTQVFGLLFFSTLAAFAADIAALKQQVIETEASFAATMASRDFDRFASFVATDAVFFSRTDVLRGKSAVLAAWKTDFSDKTAPFSWAPGVVEVLESGDLALSSGPVYDRAGKQVATFTSIWRLENDKHWRIVFDKGNPVCN